MEEDYQIVMDYALNLLGRFSYTEGKLTEKILQFCKKKNVQDGHIIADKVMGRLRELDYINDKKYAESFILDRVRIRNWGRNKIRNELYKKRVYGEIFDQAWISVMEKDDDLVEDAIRASYKKALKKWKGVDGFKLKQKIIGYLSAKGFSYSEIKDAIEIADRA